MTHAAPKSHKATVTADEFAESLRPIVEQAREMGITSHDKLADYLTEQGVRTATGLSIWGQDAARTLKARLKAINARQGAE